MINIEEAKKFLNLLSKTNMNYFVSGGVGLDGLRKKVSREHKDIDIYLFSEDLDKFIQFVKSLGYKVFKKSLKSKPTTKLEISPNSIAFFPNFLSSIDMLLKSLQCPIRCVFYLFIAMFRVLFDQGT